jgi:hypothetical protein
MSFSLRLKGRATRESSGGALSFQRRARSLTRKEGGAGSAGQG